MGLSDYQTLSAADLTDLTENWPGDLRLALSQNEKMRKYFIDKFKRSFSLAQVAETEGLQETDNFKRQFNLMIDGLLASGLEKERAFTVQVKFKQAELLENQYEKALARRFQLTPEEKSRYIAEHPEADPEKIRQKAEGILERLKKGESFEKLADEINEDGTKGKCGDLGWLARGKMPPEFANAAFALEKGQTSRELVKTKYGYHIIRVEDKRQVKPKVWVFEPGWDSDPETVEEIHARQILISTREVDRFEQRLVEEKVKKVLAEMEARYQVEAPDDFLVAPSDDIANPPQRRRDSRGGAEEN